MDKTLHIKGQMVFMGDWEQILFLACPIMKDLSNLLWSGLFVNDLRYKLTGCNMGITADWVGLALNPEISPSSIDLQIEVFVAPPLSPVGG